MELTRSLIAFALSFALSFGLVPYIHKLALRTGFVDVPTERKIHKTPTPLLGGVAMMVSFFITTAALGHANKIYVGMLVGAFLMFATGLVDDWYKTHGKDLPAWPKLIVQIIAACIVIYSGIEIKGFESPFNHQFYSFQPWVMTVTTLVWIVGITNMFNFLDGVDGLAAGIAAISASTLVIISFIKGEPATALYAIMIVGVCLGFLRHNFHPARIYMGDSGSTFLGFILATIAVNGAFKSATLLSVLVPVLALGVPIFDTMYVFSKRMKENRPLHKADRSHTFYQMMRAGMNQVQTVSFLYLLGVCFSLASILVLLVNR